MQKQDIAKKLESELEQIHFGHFGLVLGVCVFLLVTTIMRKGWPEFLVHKTEADQVVKKLTYADVRKEVEAEMSLSNSSRGQQDISSQLALIDPDYQDGSVLGASTGSPVQFPAAEEVFTPEVLSKISIHKTLTTYDNLKKYSERVAFIESSHDVLNLLSDLNATDVETLSKIPDRSKEIVADLSVIEVPDELEEYHKLKMIYYTTVGDVAKSFSGAKNSPKLEDVTAGMFGLIDRMERIRTSINNKYQTQI